jgi:thiamine-phosphate pyrophosphorylase
MGIVFPPLYAIIDHDLLTMSELSFAELMVDAGVELLQIRAKHVPARVLFEVTQHMAACLSRYAGSSSGSPRLIVNDRADIALLAKVGGVHVGQDDLDVGQARAIVGRERWVGVSTHTLEQVEAAEQTTADYVAFGPVFPTATKQRPDPVVGIEGLAAARARTRKPLVAIGGITLERAGETYAAGADSLAVARDLIAAADPRSRALAFLEHARLSRPPAGSERP